MGKKLKKKARKNKVLQPEISRSVEFDEIQIINYFFDYSENTVVINYQMWNFGVELDERLQSVKFIDVKFNKTKNTLKKLEDLVEANI